MKTKYIRVMAVLVTAIFLSINMTAYAAPSKNWAADDYREKIIYNQYNQIVNKPIAQFSAERSKNGEVLDSVMSYDGYDLNKDFPILYCYVGDTLTFTDYSRCQADSNIIEWDWQRFGTMGDSYRAYKYNIVNEDSYYCAEPGETIFYLCVKSDVKVKNGNCEPWSENGNHQNVGTNKWYPNGIYWYFTAVRVLVKPVRDARVNVRYWDTQNNKIVKEETINVGQILKDEDVINTLVHIEDLDGYSFSKWNVRLPDGSIQYDGTDREVQIELSGWLPEKFLDIELCPINGTEVEVRYWDSKANQIISTDTLTGQQAVGEQEVTITAPLTAPTGFKIDGWNVQLPDGTVQYTGTDNPVNVVLSGYIPRKYVNVECSKISDTSKLVETKVYIEYIDSENGTVIDSEEVAGKPVYENEETRLDAELKSIPGYVVTGWEIKYNDAIQQSGIEDPVSITLSAKEPVKTLEVECLKIGGSDDIGTDDDFVPDEPEIIVKPDGECIGEIEWTETDSHRVITGYDNRGRPRYGVCRHTFTYMSTLSAETGITPDVFKSGYGFEVAVDYSISTKLISNDGGCSSWNRNRRPTAAVRDPENAVVYIPWDMTNRLGTQAKAISMEKSGTRKFILPVSTVSEAGARKIYTPVALAGTQEAPVTHEFEIYISGGGVQNIEFCKKLVGRITINGDMYEDDFSGAD